MIYHITTKALWEYALLYNVYKHPSVVEEGFIHCSTAAQLPDTLKRYFGEYEEVIVLEILEKRVAAQLRWETASNGGLYPHIYGNIKIEAFHNQQIWIKNAAGEWESSD